MNHKILICIPARFHSTRLPGKPLLKVNNKTIIQHVIDKVNDISYNKDIVVLTDDNRIKDEVDSYQKNICHIIEEECLNGTDRIIKYLNKINSNKYELVVNVQGDEPFIESKNIELTIQNYFIQKNIDKDIVCSTMYFNTYTNIDIMNKSRVKLVLDKNNNIMYGSRSIIPGSKASLISNTKPYKIHIGLFVFDIDYLKTQYNLENTENQLFEDIEWLKIIEQGKKINSISVESHEIGIDTYNDYLYLKEKYEN